MDALTEISRYDKWKRDAFNWSFWNTIKYRPTRGLKCIALFWAFEVHRKWCWFASLRKILKADQNVKLCKRKRSLNFELWKSFELWELNCWVRARACVERGPRLRIPCPQGHLLVSTPISHLLHASFFPLPSSHDNWSGSVKPNLSTRNLLSYIEVRDEPWIQIRFLELVLRFIQTLMY